MRDIIISDHTFSAELVNGTGCLEIVDAESGSISWEDEPLEI